MKLAHLATIVISAGLLVGGCAHDVNMPAAGAAGWRGRNPNTENTVRFVVIADRTGGHMPGEWEKAIAEINHLQPDMVISVGDVIEGYKDDPQVLDEMWREVGGMVSKLDAPYFYVAGNHDVESGNPAEPNKSREIYLRKHAVQGHSYYSFDFKNAHFIALDSTWIAKDPLFAEEQLSWLRDDIAKAAGAQHIFVFYHHPLWDNKQYWASLASILPKGKTTIFNGHTHSMSYRLADGIPTYVMPSTGANNNASDPAQQHVFAYVTLNGTKPSISFVPVGAIRTEAFAQTIGQMQEMIAGTGAVAELPASGGELALNYANTTSSPLSVAISITAPGWTIDPTTAKVDVAAGSSAEARFTAKPQGADAAAPKVAEKFTLADGTSFSRDRAVPVFREGELGNLPSLAVDGKSDEWSNVTPIEMASAGLIFQNAAAWKGPADQSSSIRVATTSDKLAFLIEVKDDQMVMNEQANPWEQDGLEMCWDVRSESKPGMTAGAGQIALTPAADEGAAKKVIWIPAGKQAPSVPDGVECYTRRVEGGYIAEVAIPISDLGAPLAADQPIRISLTQDDLDGGDAGAMLKRMSLTGTGDFWRTTAGYAKLKRK